MKKTSIYLGEREREHLARLAERTGRSQSELVREAIAAYDVSADRDFELLRAAGSDSPPKSRRVRETPFDQRLRDHLVEEHRRNVGADPGGQQEPVG